MPKPTKGPRLGGGPAHERLLLANLSAALITHKSITTTITKAKRVSPMVERLITFGKRGDLHARRRAMTVLRSNKEAAHILFTEIAPLVADRQGGYTRITKIGNRKGDNAPMAVIELVLEPVAKKNEAPAKKASSKKAAKKTDAAAEAAPVEGAVVEEAVVEEAAPVEDAAVEAAPEEAAVDEAAAAEAPAADETVTDEAKDDEAKADEAKAE